MKQHRIEWETTGDRTEVVTTETARCRSYRNLCVSEQYQKVWGLFKNIKASPAVSFKTQNIAISGKACCFRLSKNKIKENTSLCLVEVQRTSTFLLRLLLFSDSRFWQTKTNATAADLQRGSTGNAALPLRADARPIPLCAAAQSLCACFSAADRVGTSVLSVAAASVPWIASCDTNRANLILHYFPGKKQKNLSSARLFGRPRLVDVSLREGF